VAIVIATDGLPTSCSNYTSPVYGGFEQTKQEFVNALRSLEGLPVWIVIRLCTDEESVVSFYNDIDASLELSMEVLDDFCGEGKKIFDSNPWLNYGLPLHRMREMGYHDRLFDLLDERLLTKSELRDFCYVLFGEEKGFDGLSDPNIDWETFVHDIERLVQITGKTWDPITKKLKPWIDTKSLHMAYRNSFDFLFTCDPIIGERLFMRYFSCG